MHDFNAYLMRTEVWKIMFGEKFKASLTHLQANIIIFVLTSSRVLHSLFAGDFVKNLDNKFDDLT